MKAYYDALAPHRLRWKKKNRYYHALLEKYFRHCIPPGKKVIEIGCGTGELLASVRPSVGVGVDLSAKMIEIARQQFPDFTYIESDVENLSLNDTFDYIILSDLLCSLRDVQRAFNKISAIANAKTRMVISNYNYMWEPILRLGEKIGLKAGQPLMNWLSLTDIRNLLELEGFEIIKIERRMLFPKKIPVLSGFLNVILANLPIINIFTLVNFIIARKTESANREASVSIVVPARNEMGNIEKVVLRTPVFGQEQEFIFIEGHSKDGTYDEMLRVRKKYAEKNIVVMRQTQKGKGNAVREAFEVANGEVLMILDADLTMPPEDLPKYYKALVENKADFINGCRLVYPMQDQAMRFLNLIANKFFGMLFSYLLNQPIKDTLCGTKVLFRSDYQDIKTNRSYFGDFDPFGDFDLLFGAAKQNLKIVQVPIRYSNREYGETQIKRFSHGWLLIKMSIFAARKMKFL